MVVKQRQTRWPRGNCSRLEVRWQLCETTENPTKCHCQSSRRYVSFATVQTNAHLFHGELRPPMSTTLSTVNYWLVIPLSLGDYSTATNKPLMRHRTVTTSATGLVEKQPIHSLLQHSLLWSLLTTPWNKKVTARSTAYYARYTRISRCRPCCNLRIVHTVHKMMSNNSSCYSP